MSDLPKKIYILGLEYTLEIVDDEKFCDETRGELDPDLLTIKISSILNNDLQKKTLIHELVHGFVDSIYPELNDDEEMIEKIGNICYFMIMELQRLNFKL